MTRRASGARSPGTGFVETCRGSLTSYWTPESVTTCVGTRSRLVLPPGGEWEKAGDPGEPGEESGVVEVGSGEDALRISVHVYGMRWQHPFKRTVRGKPGALVRVVYADGFRVGFVTPRLANYSGSVDMVWEAFVEHQGTGHEAFSLLLFDSPQRDAWVERAPRAAHALRHAAEHPERFGFKVVPGETSENRFSESERGWEDVLDLVEMVTGMWAPPPSGD